MIDDELRLFETSLSDRAELLRRDVQKMNPKTHPERYVALFEELAAVEGELKARGAHWFGGRWVERT